MSMRARTGRGGCVDVHCHVVPLELPLDPTGGRQPLWPTMQCHEGRATFVAGPTSRQFDDRSWLASRRLDYMDEHDIELQVLSPLPELLGYWFEAAACELLCRHTNNVLADMVTAYPTRFAALGALPMTDTDRAIEEARRLKRLGFVGVEMGSNINGISPADPCFADVLTALHELQLAIFVHGVRPQTAGRLVGPDVLGAVVGVPLDTALSVASFIACGVLDKLPRLRLGFSHGGGAIGSIIDRFEHVWSVMPELRQRIPKSPLAEARRFFYDILTFGGDYTRYLVDQLGSARLFIGTDFPAGGMGLMQPVKFVRELNLPAADESNLLRGTAERFLNIRS